MFTRIAKEAKFMIKKTQVTAIISIQSYCCKSFFVSFYQIFMVIKDKAKITNLTHVQRYVEK